MRLLYVQICGETWTQSFRMTHAFQRDFPNGWAASQSVKWSKADRSKEKRVQPSNVSTYLILCCFLIWLVLVNIKLLIKLKEIPLCLQITLEQSLFVSKLGLCTPLRVFLSFPLVMYIHNLRLCKKHASYLVNEICSYKMENKLYTKNGK